MPATRARCGSTASSSATLDEKAAGELGIGIVHQEGSLVAAAVGGGEHLRRPAADAAGSARSTCAAMRDGAAALIGAARRRHRSGAARSPTLSPAQAQIVEIAKALSRDLRILILDEPTAALTLTETEKLFDMVRRLARDGVSVIYVSHRLAEIFALCHRVTVLKDGSSPAPATSPRPRPTS